jgi:hypothetical protein
MCMVDHLVFGIPVRIMSCQNLAGSDMMVSHVENKKLLIMVRVVEILSITLVVSVSGILDHSCNKYCDLIDQEHGRR